MTTFAVKIAHNILNMDDRIARLEAEVARLKWFENAYNELLQSSVSHGETMMNNILKLAMTPGVIEACKANNTEFPAAGPDVPPDDTEAEYDAWLEAKNERRYEYEENWNEDNFIPRGYRENG